MGRLEALGMNTTQNTPSTPSAPCKIASLFPTLCSDQPEVVAQFYCQLLGLNPVFYSDWYIQLQDNLQSAVQLAVVAAHHNSVPEGYQIVAKGVLITLELENADLVYERAHSLELKTVMTIRDEVWGQRHFMVEDPDGRLVDIVQIIPMDPEFAKQAGLAS